MELGWEGMRNGIGDWDGGIGMGIGGLETGDWGFEGVQEKIEIECVKPAYCICILSLLSNLAIHVTKTTKDRKLNYLMRIHN